MSVSNGASGPLATSSSPQGRSTHQPRSLRTERKASHLRRADRSCAWSSRAPSHDWTRLSDGPVRRITGKCGAAASRPGSRRVAVAARSGRGAPESRGCVLQRHHHVCRLQDRRHLRHLRAEHVGRRELGREPAPRSSSKGSRSSGAPAVATVPASARSRTRSFRISKRGSSRWHSSNQHPSSRSKRQGCPSARRWRSSQLLRSRGFISTDEFEDHKRQLARGRRGQASPDRDRSHSRSATTGA